LRDFSLPLVLFKKQNSIERRKGNNNDEMAPYIAQLVLSGFLLLREEVIRDESLSEYVER
jgi:hypothetical protein